MKRKLTAASLTNSSLGAGEHWDASFPGLHIRIGTTRKTWMYRYRLNGRQHRDRLGFYPIMTLSKAREAAATIDKRIEHGLPSSEPPPTHPRTARLLTVGRLFDLYEKMRQAEGTRIKGLKSQMQSIRHLMKPYLDVPAASFSKADLRAARDTILERGTPSQATSLVRKAGPIWRWASHEDFVPVNFVGDLRVAPDRKRTRILTPDELRAIWAACHRLQGRDAVQAYGRLVRFLMVTGCRLSEAANMRHGDILDGTWRQTDNKASRPHRLPLPRLALDQIGNGVATELAFPGRWHQQPLGGFSRLKAKLDRASGVEDWVLHDLRRSFVSGLGDLGIHEMVIRSVINHAVASGALANYMHAELEKQKRAALEMWSAKLARIVGTTTTALTVS